MNCISHGPRNERRLSALWMLPARRASLVQTHATNRLSCRVGSFQIRWAVIGIKLERDFMQIYSWIKLSSITVPKWDNPPICGTWPGSSTLQQSVRIQRKRSSVVSKWDFFQQILPTFSTPRLPKDSYLNIYSGKTFKDTLISFAI